jgi:citrate synthase
MSKVIKVSDETHAKLARLAKWGETMDEVIQRLASQSKGLEDVIAGQSSICFIDGKEGRLLYRGYDIKELCSFSSYEETVYLLWYNRLPTEDELTRFASQLASKRTLPRDMLSILNAMPRNVDAMDALRVLVASLGLFDDPLLTNEERAAAIASRIGTIVAAIHRYKHNLDIIEPDASLPFASNFLYMLTGSVPDKENSKLMDVLLILHADHEFNASTFTARVIASTLSDVYSAITGAVGALKGPLHGGANEKVVEMTKEIGTPENAEKYILSKLSSKQKVMGFGHRVYRTMDPRAQILKDMASQFVKTEEEKRYFEILKVAEEVMKREKNLYPNVDLYSGLALNHLGILSYLFTPFFAVGRTPGWLAHVLEQYSDNRIIRPRAEYTGPELRKYVPIESRASTVISS